MIEPAAVDGGEVPIADAFQIHILYFSSEGLAGWDDPLIRGFGGDAWLCLHGGSHPMDHVIVKPYLTGPLILATSHSPVQSALSILPRFTALQMQKED
jgi:hypothetical protein